MFCICHHVNVLEAISLTLSTFNINLPEESTDEEKEYVEKWGLVVQLRYSIVCK